MMHGRLTFVPYRASYQSLENHQVSDTLELHWSKLITLFLHEDKHLSKLPCYTTFGRDRSFGHEAASQQKLTLYLLN